MDVKQRRQVGDMIDDALNESQRVAMVLTEASEVSIEMIVGRIMRLNDEGITDMLFQEAEIKMLITMATIGYIQMLSYAKTTEKSPKAMIALLAMIGTTTTE